MHFLAPFAFSLNLARAESVNPDKGHGMSLGDEWTEPGTGEEMRKPGNSTDSKIPRCVKRQPFSRRFPNAEGPFAPLLAQKRWPPFPRQTEEPPPGLGL